MTTEDIAKFSSFDDSHQRLSGEASHSKFGLSPAPRNHGHVISTGLQRLDAALSLPVELRSSPWGLAPSQSIYGPGVPEDERTTGVQRGAVTEIVGPRGTGKTVLGLSLAAEVLWMQQNVVWIDTAGPMCSARLDAVLEGKINGSGTGSSSIPISKEDCLTRLLHFHPPSIAHLMALITRPPPGFPPKNTGLIVVDSISCLFAAEFPPRLPKHLRKKMPRKQNAKLDDDSDFYFNIIGTLVSSLRKLAIRLNCAVVVINEMASRFQPKRTPMLHEMITGFTWDAGVASSILLYWHWLPLEMREREGMKSVRIAEVRKVDSIGPLERSTKRIVPFIIENTRLREFLDEDSISVSSDILGSTPLSGTAKRKLEEVDSSADDHNVKMKPTVEVNSADEDYDDDDEILDPLPNVNDKEYEVPDSESDLAVSDMQSPHSDIPLEELDRDMDEFVHKDLYDDSYLYC